MPKYPINLARSFDGMESVAPSKPPEQYYPSTHLEWERDYELPEEGTITFRYRVTREVDDKKAEKNCVDLDFLEIVDVKPSKTSRDDRAEASENLDKLRASAEGY